MKIPSFSHLAFAALETTILVFPLAFIFTRAFGLFGAGANAGMVALFVPFLLGIVGMLVWLLAYHLAHPIRAKVALSSFLIIFLLALLTMPVIYG